MSDTTEKHSMAAESSNTGIVSSMASLPVTNRKRNINYAMSNRVPCLSKLQKLTEFAQEFTFAIRDIPPAPRVVTVNGKRKQVLTFVLYDGTNRSFEATVWDKRVNGVYMFLSSLTLPACIYISHAKVHSPSKKHTPKTSIKNMQLTIDNQAVVDLSTLTPPTAASKSKRKDLKCDCTSKCDRSCSVVTPPKPWTFKTLAQKLSVDGGIMSFRGLHFRIKDTPKVTENTLLCTISDGNFLARYEGRNPDFEIGNGTDIELDVFDALFYCYAPGKMTMKIIPHDKRPIKSSLNDITEASEIRLITPADVN